jgi:hypothetical protein
MRRLVVALAVLAFATTLTGCGGGEEPTPASTAPVEQPAAAPVQPEGALIPADITPTETVVYEPLVVDTSTVPAAVTQRIDQEQPMLIMFYDSEQPVTSDQSRIISALLGEYKGLVDYVSFDIGKYILSEPDGSFTVDKKLAEDETATQALGLAETLGITFTPYIVITDADGYIVYRGRGLVDKKTLEREVLRVGE